MDWVFVTGGSRGIGKGIVRTLVSAGYHVVFTYRNSIGHAQALEALIRDQGGSACGIQCDGTNARAVTDLAERLIDKYGAPKAVINNSGIARDGLMMKMSETDWSDVMSNNLSATFCVTRAFLSALVSERNGAIIFMSSVTAIKGNVGQTSYAASKAALLGVARSLSCEVARFNVRVNAIVPGLIETEMLDDIPEKERHVLQKSIPMRRLGRVEEVAELVRYLISDAAAYITGQHIVIDGGFTA